NHPNVVKFYGMFYKSDDLSGGHLWMILEVRSPGLSLTDLIKGLLMRGQQLLEPVIAYILYGALLGLQHLYNNQIIHCDVKGNNMLLTTEGGVMLVDLGVSAQLTRARLRRNTSFLVLACKQQYDSTYDARCDVWSLGITAIENPSPTLCNPEEWCRSFSHFIAQCLIKDFETCPSVTRLLEHPFIKQAHGKGSQSTAVHTHLRATRPGCLCADLLPAGPICTVISGESGTGKTESAHLIVQNLTCLGKVLLVYVENQHGKVMQDVVSNKLYKEEFDAIQDCFRIIGFTDEVQLHCSLTKFLNSLWSILCTGNIEFTAITSQHQTDKSEVPNAEALENVKTTVLMEALTSYCVVTRGETIIRTNTVDKATEVRDAMSKALYGYLFSWLVNRNNALLQPEMNNYAAESGMNVGILVIFGFENFKKNSFEQLCINIANEQIQVDFNQHIFALEQLEYQSEGVDASLVEYEDNHPILDMFLQKPMGLFSLMDEESRFPQGTDQVQVDTFEDNLHYKYFWRPKHIELCFGIHHYAGKVLYNVNGFLEKTRDALPADIVVVLRTSDNKLLQQLLQPSPLIKVDNVGAQVKRILTLTQSIPPCTILPVDTMEMMRHPEETTNMRRQTVASYFRYSLMDLLSKMVVGRPHFVRCMKPNDDRQALRFCKGRVMTVNIRHQGYSHRILFEEFVNRYYYLAFRVHQVPDTSKENAIAILERANLENLVLGKTKVFLKYFHVEQLNLLLREVIARVVVMQFYIKGWPGCEAFFLSIAWRGHTARQNLKQTRKEKEAAAVCIKSGKALEILLYCSQKYSTHSVGHFWNLCPVYLQQRTPPRRGQQPKLLNSPEDSLYYNQLNVSSKCQIKVLYREDEYYKLLSMVESIPEEDYWTGAPPTLSREPLFSQN
uniref:Myosin IIIB n=1 Tax=Hucho hucho TaxID=62062 RepID=A0A4W5JYI7_9TELE